MHVLFWLVAALVWEIYGLVVLGLYFIEGGPLHHLGVPERLLVAVGWPIAAPWLAMDLYFNS